MSLLRTGVGSLPHKRVDEAIRFVNASTDIPYLPQLPNRHEQESMLVQWGVGIAGAGTDGTQLKLGGGPGNPDESFVAADAMLRSVRSRVVKTQATGPVTLAAALRAGGASGRGLIDEVVVALIDRINEHISWIKASAFVQQVVVVLDEPALAVLGPDQPPLPTAARRSLERLLVEIDAEVGIHCCGDADWGGLAELGFDWLSWDLSSLAEGFLAGVDQIARAIGSGTRVIWGIVPTTAGPLPETNVLVGRYGAAVANLVVAGAPTEMLKAQAWFSPACGLAGLSVSDAEAVAERLAEVVEEVASGW